VRVAILSAIEPFDGESIAPAGFARIGGRSILQHQLDVALALGCERVTCLSNDLPSVLIQLQHDAEAAGVQFQTIRNVTMLSKLVGASDEILVVSDRLVCKKEVVEAAFKAGRGVLTFPAKQGVAAGFERIDNERSWAGVMLIGGAMIERLAELPADIDPQSSLLRLALQSGAKAKSLDVSMLSDREWTLVASTQDAQDISELWLKGAARIASIFAPFSAIADICGRAVLRRHDEPEKAALVGKILSAVVLAGAAVCAWFLQPVAGFFAVLFSVFSFRFGQTISDAVSGNMTGDKGGALLRQLQPIGADLVMVFLVFASVPSAGLTGALFAIFVLLGMIRIVEAIPGNFLPFGLVQGLTDRSTLALFCAAALLLGKLILIIQVFGIVLLAHLMVQTYRARLTAA